MKLSIIIVSFNTSELTCQAIKSAWHSAQVSPLLEGITEIIVVDNNSSDNSVTAIKALKIKNLKLIENQENIGFSRANNQGIVLSKGQYVLLLNSDTICEEASLSELISLIDEYPIREVTAHHLPSANPYDRLGLLAAHLLNPDGTTQAQGGDFPSLLSLTAHWLMLDDLPIVGKLLPSTQHTGRRAINLTDILTEEEPLYVQDWVGGTALLIRREVIEEIGTLDENIFMYGEDLEYCLRASHHHYDVGIATRSHITHLGSASGSSERAIEGEWWAYHYLWAKHQPLWQYPLASSILRTGALLRSLIFGTMGDASRARLYAQLAFSSKNPHLARR
jgi:GT2 family glycosyltransferase